MALLGFYDTRGQALQAKEAYMRSGKYAHLQIHYSPVIRNWRLYGFPKYNPAPRAHIYWTNWQREELG